MTIFFWIISAVLLLIALLLVAYPLLRHRRADVAEEREKLNLRVHRERLEELKREYEEGSITMQEYENARSDLEKSLLDDMPSDDTAMRTVHGSLSGTLIPVVVVLPLFVIITYLALGDLDMVAENQDSRVTQPTSPDMHSIEEMVSGLEQRLERNPDDAEGWQMLGRSYMVLNQFEKAVVAYRNALNQFGKDPGLMADLSEALILAENNSLTTESRQLAMDALQLNPDEPKALWITGYASLQQGDVRLALEYWERLLGLLPPDSNEAAALAENVSKIRQELGEVGNVKESPQLADAGKIGTNDSAGNDETGAAQGIDVHVSLDDAVRDRASAGDTVFIFARAAEGPRMPLAIVRKHVRDLPATVHLDDSLAMSPAMSLSQFNEVVVGARVSRSGNAMPKSGDLAGSSSVIRPSEVIGVKIIIKDVIP